MWFLNWITVTASTTQKPLCGTCSGYKQAIVGDGQNWKYKQNSLWLSRFYRQSPWTFMFLAWKCTPLRQSQLFLRANLSCDWLRGAHFHAKIVHVQELWRYYFPKYLCFEEKTNHKKWVSGQTWILGKESYFFGLSMNALTVLLLSHGEPSWAPTQ